MIKSLFNQKRLRRIMFFSVITLTLLWASLSVSASGSTPNIQYPIGVISRADINASWMRVDYATQYQIDLDDLSAVKTYTYNDITGTNYLIPKSDIFEGHQYMIHVTVLDGINAGHTNAMYFDVSLSQGRKDIIDRAAQMVSYLWTPAQTMKGWQGKYNKSVFRKYPPIDLNDPYSADDTSKPQLVYRGLPYSQTKYQSYAYVDNSSLFQLFVNNQNVTGFTNYGNFSDRLSAANFYDVSTTTTNETEQSMYGSDCSGFLSLSWGVRRYTTDTFADNIDNSATKAFYTVGTYNFEDLAGISVSNTSVDNTIKELYAKVSPGDAFIITDKYNTSSTGHVFLVYKIEKYTGRFFCYEQHVQRATGTYWEPSKVSHCEKTVWTVDQLLHPDSLNSIYKTKFLPFTPNSLRQTDDN